MTSQELSAWWVLLQVRADEAQHQRDIVESGDGVVTVSGLDEGDDDDGE